MHHLFMRVCIKRSLCIPKKKNLWWHFVLILRRNESVTKAGVAMVGDLADALGPNIKLLFKDSKFHSELLGQCCQSDDEQLRETASWVQGVITRVLVSWGKISQVKLLVSWGKTSQVKLLVVYYQVIFLFQCQVNCFRSALHICPVVLQIENFYKRREVT